MTVELYNGLLLVAVVPAVAVVVAYVYGVGRNTTLCVAFVAVVSGFDVVMTVGVAVVAVTTVFRLFSAFVTVNYVAGSVIRSSSVSPISLVLWVMNLTNIFVGLIVRFKHI